MLDDDHHRYLTNAAAIYTILRNAFPPPLQIYTLDDPDTSTKGYRIGGADIRDDLRHRIDVSREFLVDHPRSEIKSLLLEWRLIDEIRAAGLLRVLVTNDGVRVERKK